MPLPEGDPRIDRIVTEDWMAGIPAIVTGQSLPGALRGDIGHHATVVLGLPPRDHKRRLITSPKLEVVS